MTPEEFLVEYWKVYEGYMRQKEHLIEAAVTLYSGLALAVLLRATTTWTERGPWLVGFGIFLGLLVLAFVRAQLRMWGSAAEWCDASQTAAAECLEKSWAGSPVFPVGHLNAVYVQSRVKAPAILGCKIGGRQQTRWQKTMARLVNDSRLLRWWWPSPFAGISQCLVLFWCVAFLVRALFAIPDHWWIVRPWWDWWCEWSPGMVPLKN